MTIGSPIRAQSLLVRTDATNDCVREGRMGTGMAASRASNRTQSNPPTGSAFDQHQLSLIAVVVTHPLHFMLHISLAAALGREVEHVIRAHHHLYTASVGRV